MTFNQNIIFYVNGKRQVIEYDSNRKEFRVSSNKLFTPWPDMTLVQFLRNKEFFGTKLGCGEG